MNSVLITGGAGFIGSDLTDELLLSGYAIRILDNLSPQMAQYDLSEYDGVLAFGHALRNAIVNRHSCAHRVNELLRIVEDLGLAEKIGDVA